MGFLAESFMKDPAFLFYPDNFQSGTQFFTDEQVGKYIRLLCAQHIHGHLSEKQVLMICGTHDKDILRKFKKDEEGMYFNERLENEIFKRKKFSESRKRNRLGKRSDKLNISSTHDKHIFNTSFSQDIDMGNGNGNINENINKDSNSNSINNNISVKVKKVKKQTGESFPDSQSDIFFERFWNEYGKKTDRNKCEIAFKKITAPEISKIFERLPEYIASTPEVQYRKNPLTWLNGKCWNDEYHKTNYNNGTKKSVTQANTNQLARIIEGNL